MSVRIINADVMDGLAQLPDESVHCCVTSPPYYGLRDYGVEGQIGLEATPDEFVARLVCVFREVRRVLRSDGTLWLNIGDSYANDGKWGGSSSGKHVAALHGDTSIGRGKRSTGLKPKDLIGIPWMLAFALRADGWWLRSGNVWAKPNGMPESATDRPGVGHEYVFQLSKSASYYYDAASVRLPPLPQSVSRLARAMRSNQAAGDLVMSGGGYAPPGQPPHQGARARAAVPDKQRGHGRRHAGFNDRWDAKHSPPKYQWLERAQQQSDGCNLRSVWWIATGGFPDAHFATMPEELAAVCVSAGCPSGGTVLDPFSGAGTTCLVADRLQRNGIGIEINPEYAAMAERRVNRDRGGLLNLMEAAE